MMPERNIKLNLKYDGTNYSGWQSQDNANSIQAVIESALKVITGRKTKLVSAGRTDAGVHAKGQIANFRTMSGIPLKNIQKALNTALPKDIVISDIKEADPDFHARNDARSKRYRYTLVRSDFVDPLIRHFAVRCKYKLNLAAMRREARNLIGRRDFKSFQAAGSRNSKDTTRTVKDIRISNNKDIIYIDIEASGFLYNMARNIVGTLIEVGRGKMAEGAAKTILRKRDRRSCGPTAPGKGLCLVKVKY